MALALAGPTPFERLGERGGIGGVDVDRLGVHELREQHHGGERGDEFSER